MRGGGGRRFGRVWGRFAGPEMGEGCKVPKSDFSVLAGSDDAGAV